MLESYFDLIDISNVRPGMILATDLTMGPQRFIEGTRLTQEVIKFLRDRGVVQIAIARLPSESH